MELPDDVLKIIREYSKPLTRSDWRQIHIMPEYIYKQELRRHSLLHSPLMRLYYIKIRNITFWIDEDKA